MTAGAPAADDAGERPVPRRLVERIAADAAAGADGRGLRARVTPFAARGGRVVLEYRLDGGLRLFAKRFPRPGDAVATYEALGTLRSQGFGADSSYRVPEPLACAPDEGVVVMRAAAGSPLATVDVETSEWEQGVRAAAAWLARLHALAIGLGPRDDAALGALALARRAAAAAARRPELLDIVLVLVEELEARGGGPSTPRMPVQTHGRFHAAHVYLAGGAVTVIDLDRAALADPAKDVGEFLHRLRTYARRRVIGPSAAERATAAFLREYADRAGAVPSGLAYYWSYSVLATLLRVAALGRPRWERRVEFYRREFAEVPRRVAALAAG